MTLASVRNRLMHHLARATGILVAEGKVDESPTGPLASLSEDLPASCDGAALHLPGSCSQAWDGDRRPVNLPGGS